MNLMHLPFKILVLSVALLLTSCTKVQLFSFQGGQVHPDARTISVMQFFDDVGAGPPTLSQTLTEKVRDYFVRNTKLTMSPAEGDLQFEGRIVGYDVVPMAPTGDQLAGLQRLTITVQVQFINTFDEELDFDKSFSFYADFEPDKNITDVENELIPIILDQIVIDIFNQSIANW